MADDGDLGQVDLYFDKLFEIIDSLIINRFLIRRNDVSLHRFISKVALYVPALRRLHTALDERATEQGDASVLDQLEWVKNLSNCLLRARMLVEERKEELDTMADTAHNMNEYMEGLRTCVEKLALLPKWMTSFEDVDAKREVFEVPSYFKGREEEIGAIQDRLTEWMEWDKGHADDRRAVKVVQLHGPDGIGKTALAMQLARRMRWTLPDKHYHVDMHAGGLSTLTAAQVMKRVIVSANATATPPSMPLLLAAMYSQCFAARRSIFVLDNVEDAADVRALLPTCRDANVLLIVVCATPLDLAPPTAATAADDAVRYWHEAWAVGGLSERAGKQMLLSLAPRLNDNAVAVARACAFVPNAMLSIGKALENHPQLAPADLMALLRAQDDTAQIHMLDAYLAPLLSVFTTDQVQLLLRLSVFPGPFRLAALPFVLGAPYSQLVTLVRELERGGLLLHDEDAKTYRVDNMVRRYGAARLGDDVHAQLLQRFVKYYARLVEQVNEEREELGGGDTCTRDVFVSERENIEYAMEVAKENGWMDALRLIAVRGKSMWPLVWSPADRVHMYEQVLARYQAEKAERVGAGDGDGDGGGGDDEHAAGSVPVDMLDGEILAALSAAYRDAGKVAKSVQMAKQALGCFTPDSITETREELLYAWTLTVLYSVLYKRRAYAEAAKYATKSLKIYQHVFDNEHHPLVCAAHSAVGMAQLRLGEWAPAASSLQAAAGGREHFFGDRHWLVGESVNDLGLMHYLQQQYEAAEEHFERAVSIFRTYYPDDQHVATVMINMGGAYRENGKHAKAEESFKHALQVQERLLSIKHPDVAGTLLHLASLYQQQQIKLDEVQELYYKALAIFIGAYGDVNAYVADVKEGLGDLYQKQKRWSESEMLYEQALETYRAMHGEEHAQVALVYGKLHQIHVLQGNYERAEEYMLRNVAVQERVVGGNDDPVYAGALYRLGSLQRLIHKRAESERALKKALLMSKRQAVEDTRLVGYICYELGLLKAEQEEFRRAQICFTTAANKCAKVYGINHENTQKIRQELERISAIAAEEETERVQRFRSVSVEKKCVIQ